MESLGGFRTYSAIEEVATTLILLCAALHYFKSQLESLEGFKFQPTIDKILHLLEKKRLDPHFSHRSVKDIDDICSLEPWDLPRESDMEPEEQFCYFFYEPYYKYKESNRAHRRTNEGCWKVTGRGSEIKARNGLTGSKKILTFYIHGPGSKKTKTEWVMHEFHVKDNPSYKKEFVLCRIERKWDKKHGISTPEEGESIQQLVSPTQLLPGDHLISSGNHRDENTVTKPQLPSPNHYLISYPGSQVEQNTPTNPQPPPNHNSIFYLGNYIEQNTLTNQKLLPNQTMVSFLGNHNEQTTLSNSRILPTHNFVPYHRNHNEQTTISNTQILPQPNLVSQLVPNNLLVKNNVAENTLQEENHLLEEFNASGGCNGPNYASFSASQSPNYQEMELSYSNSSIDNFDFLNSQIDSEQANDLINLQRAFQDENSPEETGQTHSPDLTHQSQMDELNTNAEDISDKNTETFDAWLDELLLENIAK